ncbi:MAG: hypothetical protein CTY33_00355 [Methylotenera sp.]|nr:MAG: hypothetical protein CTY33_00355 [Methylotenera sp.]
MARQYLNLAEVYGAVDRSRAYELDMQNSRLQQEKYKSDIARQQRTDQEADAIKNVYRGAIETDETGAPRLNEKRLLTELYGVAPEQALKTQEGFTKRDSEASKMKREEQKANIENKTATITYLKNRLATIQDEGGYQAFKQEAEQLGAADLVKSAPPQFDPNWQKSQMVNADKFLEQNTPKYERVDLGGKIQIVDVNPVTNPNYGKFNLNKTLTPDALLTDQRTRSEGALNRENSRGNAVISASGQAQKPPAGYRWNPDGSLQAIPGGPGDKLPETNQKQITGTRNLQGAIAEYQADLANWKKLDGLNPDKRAAMGTKYNNMMLQAKEAYNLGVLNGPDLEILTSVITDPRSMKGAITSNDALDKQASELSRIMSGIAATSGERVTPNSAGQQSNQILPKNAAMPKAPKKGTVDGDYIFIGGNPSDPKSWKKK